MMLWLSYLPEASPAATKNGLIEEPGSKMSVAARRELLICYRNVEVIYVVDDFYLLAKLYDGQDIFYRHRFPDGVRRPASPAGDHSKARHMLALASNHEQQAH